MLRKVLLLVLITVLGFGVTAKTQPVQKPLLIAGWNRFQIEDDVAWWEENAHVYDDLKFDAVMHVIENYDPNLMDRVINEDKKRNFQVIVTVDGVRFIDKVFDFFVKYGDVKNASGEPLIKAAVIGWDHVNNIHPDDDFTTLHGELQAARDAIDVVAPTMAVYLCVSYSPQFRLNDWYNTMKDIPHDGIWMYDVWGWDADVSSPMQYFRDRGETNIIDGGVFGFKYFIAKQRPDLIERSAVGITNLWTALKDNNYAGVNIQFSIDAHKQHGSTALFDDNGNQTAMYKAIATLK